MRGLRSFRHRLVSSGGIAAVALLTFVTLLLLDRVLAPWRLDLTEDGIWTLSDGTRALAADLDRDVELRLYFSRAAASEEPRWADYARFVGDTLAALARAAEGRIRIERVDPRPFSDAEDAALAAGLRAAPVGRQAEPVFLGIVARTPDGAEAVLPFLDPADDALLEYRLARLLDELTRPHRPRVALVTGVPLAPGYGADGRRRPGTEIHRRLAARFDLVTGPAEDVTADLGEVDVLVLVHPRGLPPAVRWAIDQYALAGGRVLAFVDPLAERDPGAAALAFADPLAARASGARALLASWGIALSEAVVLDAEHAMPVALAPGAAPVRHLAMLALGQGAFAADDPVTARLEQLDFSTAGALEPVPDARTRFEALVHSSAASALAPPDLLLRARSPDELEGAFEPDASRYVLAARVSGPARSAFAGDRNFAVGRLDGEIEVLVVADTDLLADPLWVAPRDGTAGAPAQAWASNGDFVVNAVDQLAGSETLLSIRGQPRFSRPFERFEALRLSAEARLLAPLASLRAQLAAAGARPAAGTGAASGDSDEQARLRREIRSVQRQLTEDVERLSTHLELIGVFAAPTAVAALALVLGWRRRRNAA